MTGKQAKQKAQHDSHAKSLEVFPGQRVMVHKCGYQEQLSNALDHCHTLCKLVKSCGNVTLIIFGRLVTHWKCKKDRTWHKP